MKIKKIESFEMNGKVYKTKEELLAYHIKDLLVTIFEGRNWYLAIGKLATDINFRNEVIRILQTDIKDLEEE